MEGEREREREKGEREKGERERGERERKRGGGDYVTRTHDIVHVCNVDIHVA